MKVTEMAEAIYCVRHSTTETNITCGKCGEAVCPRCLVHAPGGLRCPDCAQSKPIPTFDVTPIFIVRGLGAGIATALATGIIMSYIIKFFLGTPLPFNIITLGAAALIAVMGLIVSEGISRAVNRKRGRRLKLVAGFSMFIGITIITLMTGATYNTLILLASGLSFYIAVNKF